MAISDYLSSIYSRFSVFSRTTTFRFIVAITASSILTSISLLSFQSFQRRIHRKALRDSVEGKLALREEEKQLKEQQDQYHNRPSISRKTTIDDRDDELIDYSDAEKAQQQRRDRKLQQQQQQQQNGYHGSTTPDSRDSVGGTNTDQSSSRIYDEEIIREQLARNIAFLGEEAVQKIRDSFVIVVGIGGVGSAAGQFTQC